MTQYNQTLIEKARRGEIAILNDGSVEELKSIMKEVLPRTLDHNGFFKYYILGENGYFHCYDDAQYLKHPAHSVKDFFMTDTQQPRTYKVTRQQMKEIWQMLPVGADGEQFRNSLHYLFDPFENEAELNHAQVNRIMKDFPEVQPSKLRSIFPSYFFIPEGEPVLVRDHDSYNWTAAISDGKGKALS